MADESLKSKAVKGVGWSTTEMILRYGVSFVIGIILARILSPDEYGLIGILMIFVTLFEIIVDGGFAHALIRKQNAKEIDYCTVFYINLLLSLLMAGILYLSAPPIAIYFEREELIPLTKALSPIVIINALAIVQRVQLTKKIDFKSQAIITFISALVSGGIGIFMAKGGYGVWALVGQQLSYSGINTILLWSFNKWWPGFHFSWVSFHEMWSFGWKLLLGSLFNSLSGQLYSAVIGKIYAPATLGQYTRGSQFVNMASSNISSVVAKVSYPVLSVIQDDQDKLKISYQRLIRTTALPTFVLLMGMCAMAKPLLLALLGPKWDEAPAYMQILCLSMLVNPLQRLNINALLVKGRSDLNLRINIVNNLLMAVPIIIGIFINIYWMLFADALRNYFAYYLNAYYNKYLLGYSFIDQLKDIIPSFLVAFGAALPCYMLGLLPFPTLILLPFQILLWIILVLVICEKTKLPEYLELKSIVTVSIVKVLKKANYSRFF